MDARGGAGEGLEELKALEKRLDADIKNARFEAGKIVEKAQTDAAAIIREKERTLLALKTAPFSAAPQPAREEQNAEVAINDQLADNLADELLEIITKPGPVNFSG